MASRDTIPRYSKTGGVIIKRNRGGVSMIGAGRSYGASDIS